VAGRSHQARLSRNRDHHGHGGARHRRRRREPQHGVIAYLTKPFSRERLQEAVGRGVEWHHQARDSRSWREKLDADLHGRRARLEEIIAGCEVDSDGSLADLFEALTSEAPEAAAHARRVAALAVGVADAIGLSETDRADIRRAALLHDLGKLALPDAILKKPAPLSAEEAALVRRHPQIGFELVVHLPFLEEAAEIVRAVHERLDGQGYPDGCAAAEVPLGARIVSAADAYDTMIRPRVFRDAITPADALLELERCTGTQFDAHVVRILKALVAVH
jgi:putative nucleotidyltransferase with HDIG domain